MEGQSHCHLPLCAGLSLFVFFRYYLVHIVCEMDEGEGGEEIWPGLITYSSFLLLWSVVMGTQKYGQILFLLFCDGPKPWLLLTRRAFCFEHGGPLPDDHCCRHCVLGKGLCFRTRESGMVPYHLVKS